MTTSNSNPSRTTSVFVLQIVGFKNSGKTTLTAEMIQRFKGLGFKVGTVKHDAHHFTIDTPGTDTWKHQQAGADVTAISAPERSAIMRNSPEPLHGLLAQMADMDIVFVEGFKHELYPKLVLLKEPEDIKLLLTLHAVAAAAVWPSFCIPAANSGVPLDTPQPITDHVSAAASFSLEEDRKLFLLEDLTGIFQWIHAQLMKHRE